jgi:cation diffusion facilitator CzcD-associated flavoprotein CzcO
MTRAIVTEPEYFDAVVIGAGFSGLYQLHRLRDTLHLRCRLLEAGDGVGGTWYWNRYPGARCDTESHAYMYYFSRELLNRWEWSQRYPPQPEIERYLNFVADQLKLRSDIQLSTRVQAATYDEVNNRWVVTTAQRQTFVCTYLITAIGCLSSANLPDIEGRDDFLGESYHTGQWPANPVNFEGKRVAVIGTGSTGIQVIPVVAEQAAELTVFQRTANYSIPARNQPLCIEQRQHFKEQADGLHHVMTHNTNGHAFWIDDVSVFDLPEAEREAKYQAAWDKGGLQFRATFKDLLTNKAANDTAAAFIKNRIAQVVNDPTTAATLTDFDHPFAAKRPPIDSHYFETFNRPHVKLVNLRRDPIERITPTGIQTASQQHRLDAIVYATGFDAMTGAFDNIAFTGRHGKRLRDVWQAGPVTYLGLQIPGFPNLFTITGPGSPSVLCNMPPQIEQHVDWITACIGHLREQGVATVEASEAAAQAWGDEVNRAAQASLLGEVPHSWYLGANVPGKPRAFMPYAGGLKRYRDLCDEVASNGYRGFMLQ